MTDKSSWTFNSLRKSIIFAWNANRIKKSKSFQNWEDDEELFEPQKIFSSIGKFQVMLVHILSKQSCPNKILPPHVVSASKSKKFCEQSVCHQWGVEEASKLSSPLYRILKISVSQSDHHCIPRLQTLFNSTNWQPINKPRLQAFCLIWYPFSIF